MPSTVLKYDISGLDDLRGSINRFISLVFRQNSTQKKMCVVAYKKKTIENDLYVILYIGLPPPPTDAELHNNKPYGDFVIKKYVLYEIFQKPRNVFCWPEIPAATTAAQRPRAHPV